MLDYAPPLRPGIQTFHARMAIWAFAISMGSLSLCFVLALYCSVSPDWMLIAGFLLSAIWLAVSMLMLLDLLRYRASCDEHADANTIVPEPRFSVLERLLVPLYPVFFILFLPVWLGAMLAQVQAWSAVNTGTANLAGLAEQADMLADAFFALPGKVELVDPAPVTAIAADGSAFDKPHGRHLVVRVRPQANRRILLTGHMDTVPQGSAAGRVGPVRPPPQRHTHEAEHAGPAGARKVASFGV
jgi:hypothetical protein